MKSTQLLYLGQKSIYSLRVRNVQLTYPYIVQPLSSMASSEISRAVRRYLVIVATKGTERLPLCVRDFVSLRDV